MQKLFFWTPLTKSEEISLGEKVDQKMLYSVSHQRSTYNTVAMSFLHQMLSLPLFQLSNPQNDSSNVLDLLFVNKPEEFGLCKDQFTIVERSQQDKCHIPFEIVLDYIEGQSTTNTSQKQSIFFKKKHVCKCK